MKTVYELSESEIEEAIREWVERKNPAIEVVTSHIGRRVLDGRECAFANVSFGPREETMEPTKKKRSSTAKTASDILGGSGGAMDRSSGLSEGLDDDDV
jgi:hypothetical protein